MKTEDFDYHLPEELIAQTPLKDRSASRLLVLDKKTGQIEHKRFTNVIDYLKPGDALVFNNTKVVPARIIGVKEATGAVIELLLLKNDEGKIWECLAKPQRKLEVGGIISFGNGELKAKVTEIKEEGITIIELIYEGILEEILDRLGTMPLPPYIHETLDDQERYQTVYAKVPGSAAASTAGLHFTEELMQAIEEKGVKIVFITLHIGLGTFRPVVVEDVTNHTMHSEHYIVSKEAADTLNEVKDNGGKIHVVGTTGVRTLETIIMDKERFEPTSGDTEIFIYPGFKFKAIDSLITNFHLPKSTLIMMISAISTKEIILRTYEEAVKEKYRFFSFGDAMFLTDLS